MLRPGTQLLAFLLANVAEGRDRIRRFYQYVRGRLLNLDVLDRDECSSRGTASEVAMSGGRSWGELAVIASSAPQVHGARGWSIGICNPDLDPGRKNAREIVNFIGGVTGDSR
jgi:hypothetical protein